MPAIAQREFALPQSPPQGAEAQVLQWILHVHTIYGRPITRAELCAATGLSDRKIRMIVSDLIDKYEQPIGSSCKIRGYYLIDNEQEALRVARELVKKAKAMLFRASRQLKSGHLQNALGQLELCAVEHEMKFRLGDLVYLRQSIVPRRISKSVIRRSDGARMYGLEGHPGLFSEGTLSPVPTGQIGF